MSKISFQVHESYPAPGVEVELDFWDAGERAGADLDFMHALARDVQQVIRNRLRAMVQRHRHEQQVKQRQQEAETIRQMEITALEDRLADLKDAAAGRSTPSDTASAAVAAVPSPE